MSKPCQDCPDGKIDGHLDSWLITNIVQAQRFSVQGLWQASDGFAEVEQVKVVFRKEQAEIHVTYKGETPVQILHVRDEPATQDAQGE